MGCKHSKTLKGEAASTSDDLSAADLEAVRRLSGVSADVARQAADDLGAAEGMGGSGFALCARDSIRSTRLP